MNKCSFCGTIIARNDSRQKIIDIPAELIVCDKCIRNMKNIKKLATNGDALYQEQLDEFINNVDNSYITDEALDSVYAFIKRVNGRYNAALNAGTGSENDNAIRFRNSLGSKWALLMTATAFVLLAIGAFLLFGNSKLPHKWICEECGKHWLGEAYYGINGTETMCRECAAEYWTPMPYTSFLKTDSISDNHTATNNEGILSIQSSDDTSYTRPSDEELSRLFSAAKAAGDQTVYWQIDDKHYHLDRDCKFISRHVFVGDGGDLLLGTLEDAFYAECFYPCSACAGDNILEEDSEMLEPCA